MQEQVTNQDELGMVVVSDGVYNNLLLHIPTPY